MAASPHTGAVAVARAGAVERQYRGRGRGSSSGRGRGSNSGLYIFTAFIGQTGSIGHNRNNKNSSRLLSMKKSLAYLAMHVSYNLHFEYHVLLILALIFIIHIFCISHTLYQPSDAFICE